MKNGSWQGKASDCNVDRTSVKGEGRKERKSRLEDFKRTAQFVLRVRQLNRLLESLTGHKLSDPVTQPHSVIRDGLPGKNMALVQTLQCGILVAHRRILSRKEIRAAHLDGCHVPPPALHESTFPYVFG